MNDFLYTYAKNVYSANGEDGINKQLLSHLKIDNGIVLEIGAWDGFFDSNCADLWCNDKNFIAILVESTDRLKKEILEEDYENVACFNEFITPDNSLENVIDKCKFEVTENNFVLASIDVDGDDLNVTRSLGKYKPIVLIVESNCDLFERVNPSGSTIQELVEFGSEFGYEFIGMSGFVGRHAGNLYFIRNDYKSKFNICKKPWTERGILLSGGVVMNKFHIIGSGACGFLRVHYILKNHIPIRYKGGGPKYQNSFETWNDSGLIWESESISKEERLRRVSLHNTTTNITHSYLKYVPEFLELHPDMKFLCLRGRREHSIKSLATSWGYRNPCYVKNRTLGLGHNRYAVDQFPNLSDSKNEFEATEKYWDEYYKIANEMQEKYSDNFIIADSPEFFSNTEYQLKCLGFVGVDISIGSSLKSKYLPIDFDDWTITTSLHGGLGNNLFQMGEVISFCKKYNLPEPIFGTWDLWNGGDKYPSSYNSDRLLGGHDGSHQDIKRTFANLNWQGTLTASFDTKFVVNDMFRFSDVDCLNEVCELLSVNVNTKPNTASLHLRFCTRTADDHVNGYVDDKFYVKVLNQLPKKTQVFIFSDDNNKAKNKLMWFRQNFDLQFEIFSGDAFQSLKKMVECEYHILHVSTFSFWAAFLDTQQPNSKVFYPESFIKTHSPNMIPYKEWQII